MPKITFLPMNVTFEVAEGESILDIAINNDVPLQHACGGFCACTTCHVHVKSAEPLLSDMEDEEMDRLELVSLRQGNSRLGCQAKVMGDVVVEIVNTDD
jgi:ferredoxin, 2Fe-2S